MSILYVDTEHERVVRDRTRGDRHAARLEVARRRLEIAAGEPCRVIRAADVASDRVRETEPTAIILSGSTTDWSHYDFGALAGLLEVIRGAPAPILGICAGYQLIGHAHGARWGPLGVLGHDEVDPDPRFAAGQRKQRGWALVELDETCSLFDGLGRQATFFQSHYWQLEEVPNGFSARARSVESSIEAIERLDRLVVGVQFHPERYDAEHGAGRRLLHNFFGMAHRQAR